MNNYLVSLGLIISLILGGIAGYRIGVNAGLDRARERLHDGLGVERGELDRLRGEIKSITDGNLVVRSDISPVELLSEKNLSTRTVVIKEDTEILRIRQKSEEKFREEVEKYRQSQRNNGEQSQPPSPVIEEEASFEDIELGDNVNIQSDEDIIGRKEFVASKIEVLETRRVQSPPR